MASVLNELKQIEENWETSRQIYTKQAILTGCEAESGAWNNAITELLADGNRWRPKT